MRSSNYCDLRSAGVNCLARIKEAKMCVCVCVCLSAEALVYGQRIKAIFNSSFHSRRTQFCWPAHYFSSHQNTCEFYFLSAISGFHRFVHDICDPLGYQAARSGNSVPTFRDNLSVSTSRVNNSSYCLNFAGVTDSFFQNVYTKLPLYAV